MRVDDAKVCEGIMRDFPKMRATLRMLEQMALSSPSVGERVDGGNPLPAAARVLEDEKIQGLSAVVLTVNGAVRDLPANLQKAVILVYMIGMNLDLASAELNCDRATVYRWCMKGLLLMSGKLKRLYDKVLDWREEWERQIRDEFE